MIRLKIQFSVILLGFLGLVQPATAQNNVGLGLYIWSGTLDRPQRLAESAFHLLQMGQTSLRFLFSPRSAETYRWSTDPCPRLRADYLACLARSSEFSRVLADPRWTSLGLTTYDTTSTGQGYEVKFLDVNFQRQQGVQVQDEYAQLTVQLLRNYGNRPGLIWISSWEGDNQIYCGEAYAFATNPASRASCLQRYARGEFGAPRSPAEAIQGLALWHKNRYLGINEGLRRYRALGRTAPRLQIWSAPEISSTRFLRSAGHADLLQGLSSTPFHALSYSAYEATNLELQTPGSIRSHLSEILQRINNRPLIIGEFGFSHRDLPQATNHLRTSATILKGLVRSGMLNGAVVWQAYEDQPNTTTFGMIDPRGRPTPLGQTLLPIFSGN